MTVWRRLALDRRRRLRGGRAGCAGAPDGSWAPTPILIAGALVFIVPFVWMFTTSLSRKANQGMPRIPTFWPPDPSEFNYMVASDEPAARPVLREQRHHGDRGDARVPVLQLARGLCVRQGPLPGPGPAVPGVPDHAVHPVPDADDPAVPAGQGPGPQQQPRGARGALPGGWLRHLLHAPGDAVRPRRPRGRGAPRRRRRVPHLPHGHAAAVRSCAGDARGHLHPLALERRPVAAPGQLRPRACTP